MNERKLRIFYEVSSTLNMTKVAEKMYVSQPSISQVIGEIEKELDVKLFDRIRKKLYLTSEGKMLSNYARRILNLYDEARKNVSDMQNLEKGELNIGASTTIGIYVLPNIIKEFNFRYPEIDICLNIDNTKNICESILNNKIDFAFVEGPVYDDEIYVQKFKTDELVFITNDMHKWKNNKVIDSKDIEHEKLIIREKGSGTRDIIEREFHKNNIKCNVFMELGNTEAIKKAVQAGMGISCISKRCIEDELEFEKLLCFRLKDISIKRELYLIYHKDKYISKLIFNFIEFCL